MHTNYVYSKYYGTVQCGVDNNGRMQKRILRVLYRIPTLQYSIGRKELPSSLRSGRPQNEMLAVEIVIALYCIDNPRGPLESLYT